MEKDIIRKLTASLSKRPRAEKDVSYVLVEIRKLLDHTNLQKTYFWLQFFADWACHIQMDRKAAKELLMRLDAELESQATGKSVPGASRPPTLSTFRHEFEQFLRSQGLRYNGLFWPDFVRYYSQIVADCPVVPKSANHKLKHIDAVRLVKYNRPANPETIPAGYKFGFGLEWNLSKNGVEVKKYPIEFIYPKR